MARLIRECFLTLSGGGSSLNWPREGYIVCNPRKLWYVQRETALTPLSPGRPRVDASSAARGSGEPSRSAQSPL